MAIKPAIGMHPLRVSKGDEEIKLFRKIAPSSDYIGEIGLDLSTEGKKTKEIQMVILRAVLQNINGGRFVTVHSRNAHEEVARLLDEYNVRPVCFHYFIGGAPAAEKIAAKGHYFSINRRMLKTSHKSILNVIPQDQILVETDGPFLTTRPLEDLESVYHELSRIWNITQDKVEELLFQNFNRCRTIFHETI